MNLTIKKEAIELFQVSSIEQFEQLTHQQVFEIIRKIYRSRRINNTTGFQSKLDEISEKYGTFVSFLYLYYEFSLNIEGGYIYLYEIGIIGECDVSLIIDLTLFKTYYSSICKYFQERGFDTKHMRQHFDSVVVEVDTREDIGYDDIEFNEIIKKIEKTQDIEFSPECNFKGVKFTNYSIGEIINVDELADKQQELSYYFIDGILNDDIRTHFNIEFAKLFDQKLNVILHIGSEPQKRIDDYYDSLDKYVIRDDIIFYRDYLGHPKKLLEDFKNRIDNAINDNGTKAIAIITFNTEIVNYIRFLVLKDMVQLQDNKFTYIDENNNQHINSIDKSGKFAQKFPSGFFDTTLEELMIIETGSL